MPTSIEKIFEDVQLHVNFTQASSRLNIVTYDSTASEPENISTAFGKLSKWYEALVPTGGSSGQILGWNSSGTAKWINNTHSLSITAAASGDTSSISLSPNTKYKLTAGGSDFIFTSPNHVSVTKSADTTSTASPDHGGTFTTVDSVTRDTWGHVTKINTKTVTLPNDTSMTQTNTTGSADYRVLLSGNANDTTETTTGRKSTNLKFNPNTGVLSASSGVTTKTITRSALKGMLTGSGTAAQDKGSGVSPRYFPAKWTFNTGLTAANGDVFIIKLPTAGHSYGVFLSIDNGANYYPISVSGTSRLTTHYGNGYSIAVMFKSDGSTADVFPLAGGDSRSTVTGGCWQVLNYYDSGNTNTKVNVTLGTTTKAYLLGTSTTPTSSAQAVTSIADTGVYLGTTAGSLYATKFVGALQGNADTATTATKATQDGDGNTISSTYLKLSGGTMTGTLTAKASQYGDEYGGALNMNNSNIYGVNAIYTADVSDNAAEGIHFYRDSTHVDTLWMNGGSLLFVPNRELGTSTTAANSQKVARFTANPTTGQVIVTDGTTGGIKSSGYTIATSVPSGAVFTDHITTVTSSGSGNAVTAISADANGALTVTKGTTFSTTDEKVKATKLAQSTAEAAYYPTLVSGAGTAGVSIFDSAKINHTPGTTSAVGNTRLILGNATASGTANNEEGLLKLYSPGTSYHTLKGASTSSIVEHTLPTTGGTILNSGTTSFTQTLSSGTKIGTIKINGTSTDLYCQTNTNTDTKVTQSETTTANYRPIVFGATNSADATTLAATITDQTYVSTLLYAQPQNGILYANRMYLKAAGSKGQLNLITAKYNVMLRNDDSNTYFLVTAQNDPTGTWTSARPLTINNSTGVCNINGNAATAGNADNANVTVTDVPSSSTTTSDPWYRSYGLLFAQNPNTTQSNTLRKSHNLRFYHSPNGTTDTVGVGELVVGNNTASGTAGNMQGRLCLYSSSSSYITMVPTATSSSVILTLPAVTGTVPSFTATPTSGQVVVTDGTGGGIKSSGYTIAKSVPSNAVFTDTKVNVTLATTTKAYLLGTSTTPTSSAQAVTSVADTGVYLGTTAGTLYATTFYGALSGNAATADLLKYLHTNEINFSGGTQATCYFNYRNADTDAAAAIDSINYKFCNYSNDTSKTTITAANFVGNASSANSAKYLSNERSTGITYGASKCEWYDLSGNNGNDPTKKQNPTNDWYQHITMHHSNSNGYYVDLAICFHSDNMSYRRISSGTDNGWVRVIDSSNIGSQSVASATKATQDESGNNIKATYAASFSISDHTITLKNKNGTSLGTVTVPDNNTTYSAGTGLSLSSTTFNHSNSVTAKTNYNAYKFKYDAQGHITSSSHWVHNASGTGGESGWIKIATMKHTATYDNTPIMLTISQRGNTIVYRLHIVFANSNSTDPGLGSFILASDNMWDSITPRAYIIKSATSTWDLYVKKLDNYECVRVSSFDVGGYFTDHMTWTWSDVQTTGDLTGGTEATKKTYSTTGHTHNYAGSSSAGGPALSVSTAGGDVVLGTPSSSSDDSGDIYWKYGNGQEKARLWQDNTYTAKAGPTYRIYKSDGTSLYNGRLPLADGTSASGTWGISITGNATSADALNLTHGNELNFSKLASTGHVWIGYRWNTQGTETSGGTTITTYKFGNANGAGGLAGLEATTSTFKSGNFGDQLIVERTGGANMAGITFKNTSGVLGYIAANTVDGDLYHYGASDTSTKKYVMLDTNNCSSYTFKVTRGSSQSTATTGYWAAMCNSSQTGSPVLPTSGKWWHVISMDWTNNDVKNWISQLAIATQDGSGVWWRRNDTGGTTIDSYSWHRLAEGNSSGAATNVATEVGSSAGARPVFYAYLGDNTRVVYNTNFTYNPSGGVLTATTFNGDLSGNATTATKASKLSNTSAIGSSTQPVYFSASGVPVACTQDANGAHFSTVPFVRNDGVMEVGRYFDMHSTNAGTTDYDVRLDASGVSSFRFGFNTPASSSVAPSTNNQTSLGTSSLNWSSVYATNIYGTHNGKVMSSNIILRQHDNYQAGIGYDTKGNECIALWAKNTVTRLRWYAGTDMTTMTSGLMMDKTPDFEVSKADGSPRVYVGGFEIGVCYIMYDEASGTATTVSNLNIPAGTKYFKIFIYDANTSGSNNVTNVIDIGVADGYYGGIISGGLQAQSFPCVITAVQFHVSTSNSLKSVTLGKSSSWTIGSSPTSGSHTLYIRKIIACT